MKKDEKEEIRWRKLKINCYHMV